MRRAEWLARRELADLQAAHRTIVQHYLTQHQLWRAAEQAGDRITAATTRTEMQRLWMLRARLARSIGARRERRG